MWGVSEFIMTTNLTKALRRFAHGEKGLDQPTYRLHLQAVGAASTLDLTREQHQQLLGRLRALPSTPKAAARARAR